METIDLIYLFICGLGVINCSVFSVYLFFSSNENKFTNRYTALLLLAFAFRIAKQIFVYFNKEIHSNYHIIWFFCLSVTAPLLYLAITFLLSFEQKKRIIVLAHFLPPIFLTLYLILHSNEMLVYYAVLTQILIYILISLILFYKNKGIQESVNKKFAAVLIIFVSGSFLIHLVANIFQFSFFNTEAIYFSVILYVIIPAKISSNKKSSNLLKKNQNSISLSDSELDLYKKKVIQYFKENKPYLNPNITLPQVAKDMNLTHHLLSKVINDAFKLNYNDFVNSYRVNYAKNLLSMNEFKNYKISIIAEESGFNSISAFNASFKKFTNTTPSKFKDLQ